MKRMLFCGLAISLVTSVVVAAESRGLRSVSAASIAPTLLTQASDLPSPMPELSPTPDPLYSQPHTTQYQPTPTPDPAFSAYPVPMQSYPVVAQPLELFPDVRYRAQRNIAPCAVPSIIQVPNPCIKDRCCKTCVNVEVCVPPCEAKKICVTRDGNKVRYDYGRYAVVVKVVGNHVVVHYED
jgi:hypothetical protein